MPTDTQLPTETQPAPVDESAYTGFVVCGIDCITAIPVMFS